MICCQAKINRSESHELRIPPSLTLSRSISMCIYSKTDPLRFYVYAYLRKDGTPYYIGKGCGSRAFRHEKKECFQTPKDCTRIIILETNLTELGANAIERRMIKWYGRKDTNTGILRNKTSGGEGTSGVVRTIAQNIANGLTKKGRTCWNNGKREKMSKTCPGKEYTLGALRDRSQYAKMGSDKSKTMIWVSDGATDIKILPSDLIPTGYSIGRLAHRQKMTAKQWWNNGTTSSMSDGAPGPNWIRGRLPVVGSNLHNTGRSVWIFNGVRKMSLESPGDGWMKYRPSVM